MGDIGRVSERHHLKLESVVHPRIDAKVGRSRNDEMSDGRLCAWEHPRDRVLVRDVVRVVDMPIDVPIGDSGSPKLHSREHEKDVKIVAGGTVESVRFSILSPMSRSDAGPNRWKGEKLRGKLSERRLGIFAKRSRRSAWTLRCLLSVDFIISRLRISEAQAHLGQED